MLRTAKTEVTLEEQWAPEATMIVITIITVTATKSGRGAKGAPTCNRKTKVSF